LANQLVVKELAKILGIENVLFNKRDLLAYSYDATQHQEMPEIVVFPRNTSEVSKIMKLAYREKIPVIPRGAGTGISGGTVPIKGCIILELSRLNKVEAVDSANRRVVAEPGVVNLDLQDILAPMGLMYPPDPASQKSCTLGGNIGENAGGPLCFRYGVTSKYVYGMKVVLPDGEVIEVGGSVEDIPGYDLRGVIIGSEGTLSIATSLTLQIVPLPEASKTKLAIFDSLEAAGQTVSDIISAGIVPSALELMDKKICGAIELSLHAGYPTDAEGVLLIEIAGLSNSLEKQDKAISDTCKKNNVREIRTAKSNAERDALWKGRKGAFGSIAKICPHYLVNDGTVPRNKLVQALLKVQELSDKFHVQIATVAHAGDGNLHPLILFDRNNPEEVKFAKKAGEEILDMCLAFGGTISGEHGIGLEKLTAMTHMFSPFDIAEMRKVKQVFDPSNILNSTKLLPAKTLYPELDRQKMAGAKNDQRSSNLFETLAEIVGPENLSTGSQIEDHYRTDGILPEAVISASSTQQVARIIKAANNYHKSIVPRGSGLDQNFGPCLKSGDIALDLKKLNQIFDFDQGNSTVRVGAGKTKIELQQEMAKYGLCFPLDGVSPENSSLGGQVSAADSGPMRLTYGNMRDLVLGFTVVTPCGDIIHPGGKTMKNVAGLDLGKLYVGSRGTLGVITEIVLRLFPLPKIDKTLCTILPNGDHGSRLVNQIMNTALAPDAMEWMDSITARYAGFNTIPNLKQDEIFLMMRITGSDEVVERHVNEITAATQANSASFINIQEGEQSERLWRSYHHLQHAFISQVPFALKGRASVPLSRTLEMFKSVNKIGRDHKMEIGVSAHAGNGVIHLFAQAEKEASRVIDDLKLAAADLSGIFVLETGPLEVRRNGDVWTRPNTYTLIQKLKSTIDPNNILNPGKI
jgi:glycolate oxidase subunit GlcD